MNPTLREPELMEIVPYEGRPLRIGDVVFFLPPKSDRPVVHRIVHVRPAGISTLGDNNTHEDPCLLRPGDIKGQVVAVWYGQKRREIAGGLRGRLRSRWIRLRCIPDRLSSRLFHPLYHELSRNGGIARLLPRHFRPHVVVFQVHGKAQFRLLLGKQVIGQYDDQKRHWHIQRPFRLFVNERELLGRQDKESTG